MSIQPYDYIDVQSQIWATVSNSLPEWMKPADIRILELLERTKQTKVGGMWLKAPTVARNLGYQRDYMGKRLRELEDRCYVESDDTFYKITDKGSEFLQSL